MLNLCIPSLKCISEHINYNKFKYLNQYKNNYFMIQSSMSLFSKTSPFIDCRNTPR